jgi:copper resistance protein B
MFKSTQQYGKTAAITWMLVCSSAISLPAVAAADTDSSTPGPASLATDAGSQATAPTTEAVSSPVPPLTDADRKAVFANPYKPAIGDHGINYFFLTDKLEWQDSNTFNWEGEGWIGGDINRLWIRTEGQRSRKGLEDADVEALWGHAISPWWDVVIGARQNFKPGPAETWGAIGIQGLALYNFELQATAYAGQAGQTSARLEGTYDFLLTNRLILEPRLEINVYGKNDVQRGQGAGVGDSSLGLRLRYEINRQFAPYIGVTWDRSYGNTARFLEQDGGRRNEVSFVAGVRVWF